MKIPTSPGEITSEWLTEALREGGVTNQASVSSVATQVMGDEQGLTGSGQVARLRVTFIRSSSTVGRSGFIRNWRTRLHCAHRNATTVRWTVKRACACYFSRI